MANAASGSDGTSGSDQNQQAQRHSGAATPALARLHIWQFQAVRDVLLIAAIVALIWLGYALRAVTVPLLVALLLAYLFEPLVSRLAAHRRLNRPIVVGGVLAVGGVVLALVLLVLTSAIVSQTTRLIDEFREGRIQARIFALREYVPEEQRAIVDDWFEWWIREVEEAPPPPIVPDDLFEEQPEVEPDEAEEFDPTDFGDMPADAHHDSQQSAELAAADEARLRQLIREELDRREQPPAFDSEIVASPIDWLGLGRGAAGAVWAFIGGLIQFGFIAFLIPFYFFFFSVGYPRIVEFGRSLIPERKKERTLYLLDKMDAVVAGFVRGRIIISLIMGVMFAFGWWLVGVPYAIVLGIVTGIFCAVPFLGIIGLPAAIGLLFYDQFDPELGLQMAWWQIILWPSLVFIIVQTIESYAITPAIAGKATNLDPVTIIVAVIAGGTVMGIYGMLLAIPVAACLKIIILEVLMPKIRAWTEGRAADPLPIEE